MTNVSMNEMNTLNSAFDADEVKLSDLEALDLVLQKPETREAFLEQIDVLVRQKEALLLSQESYKDLISSKSASATANAISSSSFSLTILSTTVVKNLAVLNRKASFVLLTRSL